MPRRPAPSACSLRHHRGTDGLQAVYLELVSDWSIWEMPLPDAFEALLQRAGCALGSQRVSLWRMDEPPQRLICQRLFDCDGLHFGDGGILHRSSSPAYFEAMETGRLIDATEASTDPRTHDLHDYRHEAGITALMDATIRSRGQTVGVLSFEYREVPHPWTRTEQEFAISLADLAAQLIINDDLRQRERRYREILGNMPSVAFRCRRDGGRWIADYVSDGIERLTGHPAADFEAAIEAAGEGLGTLIHPVDRARILHQLDEAIAGGAEEFDLSWRLTHRDGSPRWMRSLGRLIREPDDQTLRYIDGVMNDITRLVEADRAVRNSKALLAEAQSLARLGNWELNLDNGQATWSDEEYRLLGYEPGSVTANLENFMRAVHEGDRDKVEAAMREAMESPPHGHYRITHRVRAEAAHDEGANRYLEQTGQVEFHEDGRPARMVGVTQDVTERHLAQLRIRQSRQELARRNTHLRLLGNLATALHETRHLADIAQITLKTLGQLSEVRHALFFIHTPETGTLECLGHLGLDLTTVNAVSGLPFKGSLSEQAIRQRDILHSADIRRDPRLQPAVRQALGGDQAVPMRVIPLYQENEPIGSILVDSGGQETLNPLEADVLNALGKNVALAIMNARHHGRLSWQATHDSLTGLPNRGALHDWFDRQRHGRKHAPGMALYLLDLDRFKEVNDTLGHHTGDLLLMRVATVLQEMANRQDTNLARLGGDEFALLKHHPGNRDAALKLGEMLRHALQQPLEVEGMQLELDASVGIALDNVGHHDSHELLRMADIAMYEAKRSGIGVQIYSREQDAHSPQRLALMTDLGQGLRQRQLLLHYQPKVCLRSGDCVGYEALVRWQHPERGLLYPDSFVPVAEVGTLIHPMTLEIFDLALTDLRRWVDAGRRHSIAINLSARNLVDRHLSRRLAELIEKHAVPPELIEIELTETGLMLDPDTANRILRDLADQGIRIAIDDFGTGYSSMAYLRALPLHALKIDRTFVRDMLHNDQDEVIVRSTIGLAHNLKLDVVAEGVEDAPTLAALTAMDCDLAQGYHIGRPAALAQ